MAVRRSRLAAGALLALCGSGLFGPATAGTIGAGAMSAPGIVVTCAGGEELGAAACTALAETLRARDPARTVTIGGPAPEGAAEVTLTVTEAGPYQITAVLGWRDGADKGTSPPLSLSVTDTDLRPALVQPLVDALLREAGWTGG